MRRISLVPAARCSRNARGNQSSLEVARPDASTLGATAFNVGMIDAHAFKRDQDEKIQELPGHVEGWLQVEGGPAVVGLNEIAPPIAKKLIERLQRDNNLNVGHFTHESNTLMWLLLFTTPPTCGRKAGQAAPPNPWTQHQDCDHAFGGRSTF